MEEKYRAESPSIGRRKILKGIGIASTGLAGVGISSQGALGCSTYNGCDTTSQNTTYEAYIGHKTHLGSGIERKTVASYDGYWTHTFKLAGDGVAEENESLEKVVTSQDMVIENNDTDYLSVFTSKNEKETGMMPESSGGEGDGSGVVDAVTGALSVAATAAGSTAGSLALSAAAIAEGLINTFSTYEGSGTRYSFTGSYGSQGISQGGHHLRFKVDQYEDNDPYGAHSIQVRSEFGLAINGWDVSFGDRGVTISSASTDSSDSYKWTRPQDMTKKAMEHYGVKKVRRSTLDEYERQAVGTDNKYVYVAENPPVDTTPITEEEKEEIRKEKRKRLNRTKS